MSLLLCSKLTLPVGSLALLLVAVLVGGGPTVAAAQSGGLAGYWRGGGYMSPAKGRREKVRCRVWFTKQSARAYSVRARCASQAVNIDQNARVVATGRNSFSGTFTNVDFNISGRIRISLRGNRQTVSLSSAEGSGRLTLFRR